MMLLLTHACFVFGFFLLHQVCSNELRCVCNLGWAGEDCNSTSPLSALIVRPTSSPGTDTHTQSTFSCICVKWSLRHEYCFQLGFEFDALSALGGHFITNKAANLHLRYTLWHMRHSDISSASSRGYFVCLCAHSFIHSLYLCSFNHGCSLMVLIIYLFFFFVLFLFVVFFFSLTHSLLEASCHMQE